MKSSLRTHVAAAAMLIAPMGLALAFTPVAAQNAVVHAQVAVAPPVIERFVLRAPESLRPGNEVRFRLVGAPGGQAWLDIPGAVRGAAMAETRPGVYEATYVIRRHDNPDALTRSLATLQVGGQRVTSAAVVRTHQGWGEVQARDNRAPQISNLTPVEGERVSERGWTRISARISDEGSGIDPRSVTLHVDGRDVTGRVRIEDDQVRYAEDLAPGRHVAELTVRDRAGNTSQRSWAFGVRHDRGNDAGPFAPQQRW